MKYSLFLFLLFVLNLSCSQISKFTEKKTFSIKPPMDNFSYLIKGPDSVNIYKLHIKYDAYWNDTIINRGVKQAKSEFHILDAIEFQNSDSINWTFQKYKATDYNIKLEYWFEYSENEK